MKKKLISLILCLALAVTAFAACGKKADDTSSSGTEGTTETTTDTAETTEATAEKISFAVTGGGEDAMDVNPQSSGTLLGLSACRHLYEGLYKLDKDGNISLAQAASAETSDDGLTWTFTLRDDITWSDGQAVTAEDFTYGWQYLVDFSGDYSSLLEMIKEAKAVDEKTIEVTLAYPCAYLPSVLAFPSAYPARKDYVEQYGDAYATDPEKSVYNGAYEMTSWTHQESVVMTAREDYYDYANITAGEITWDLMTETSTMLASYKSGDIIYSDSYPDAEAASLTEDLGYASGYNNYCAMFNVSESGPDVLKDVKVRKALSLAIDRQRIADIRGIDDELAYTYSPSGLYNSAGEDFIDTVTPWYDVDAYEANCEEAKALLKEAGYEGGKGFPALNYIVGNEDRKTIAEAVIGDWKDVLGIDTITVEIVDGFFAQRSSKDYDIAYFGWFMDYVDISNMLYTMVSGVSDSGFSNADYDAAYEAATSSPDEATQWENYAKCEAILAEEVPVAPILHSTNSYLFNKAEYDGLVYYCGNYYFGYVTKK
ncbi:MAG: peptide ABC transporter substrate-binding protein [Lachnospiraceae bacterium]|jgi:oligopeptide transport system substrate-binding protein|nr:peptide ABC transporter substrate-binding protein [Lachnospiraceae bacterium]